MPIKLTINSKIKKNFNGLKNWLTEVFVPDENNEYLSKVLRPQRLFIYACALLLVKIAIIGIYLFLPFSNFFSAITQQNLVNLINQARGDNNLPPITFDSKLNEAANFKINDMLTNNYFEHTSPIGITPWFWLKKTGYDYAFAGENLAIDFFQTEDVFAAWMQSPAHRANILNPNFNEIGLAVKNGRLRDHEAVLAVLFFGRKKQKQIDKVTTANPTKSTIPTNVKIPSATPIASAIQSAAPAIIVISSTPTPAVIPPSNDYKPLNPFTGAAQNEFTDNATTNNSNADKIPRAAKWMPRILGVFVSRADEIAKSLYLYFALFLTLALIVNIFVKIKIQRWSTTFFTTFVILLACALIFI